MISRNPICRECWRDKVCERKGWLPVSEGTEECKHFIATDPEYEADLAAARRKLGIRS